MTEWGVVVAPLAGSVDRNGSLTWKASPICVAPLAGSVDRNPSSGPPARTTSRSLPSRGAGIEMGMPGYESTLNKVAPLAGSVDRNRNGLRCSLLCSGRSPRGERG